MEALGGNIIGVKARQLSLTPRNVTLTPEWKIEADDIILELTILRGRVEALESLNESKEIDGEIYDELLDAQKQGYLEKVKMAEALVGSVEERLETIRKQVQSLTRYLASAKLDHKSGHLDEPSLKIAKDSIEPTLKPLIAEKNDLTVYVKSLEKVIPARVSLS